MFFLVVFVITQAFAGHLGELELASMAIASNVIIGFDFGILLGTASVLETLCGKAYGAKKYYMVGVYLQHSSIVLFLCCVLLLPMYFFVMSILKLLGQSEDVAELSGVVALCFILLHFGFSMVFPLQRFLQSQLKNLVTAWVSFGAFIVHVLLELVGGVQAAAVAGRHRPDTEHLVVANGVEDVSVHHLQKAIHVKWPTGVCKL